MSEKPETRVDERVKDLAERYSYHLERWTHGRTPIWARGAFNPRDLVQEALVAVAERGDDTESGDDDALLGRLRRTLYDSVVGRVRLARHASSGPRYPVMSSLDLRLHDSALGAELLKRYEAGLGRLKPLDREAIIARAELGLPWSEVTELLQTTGVAAARTTVCRALVRLAREMSYER
jgi:DNA-directed RNA polymerase specialized sigma24 family protein